MPTDGIDTVAAAAATLHSRIAGAAAAVSVPADAGVALTPSHTGRLMLTREGEQVGPLEYDPTSFGYHNHKHWRGSLGWGRAYFSRDGRVVDGEDGPHDIVSDWAARGRDNRGSRE